MGILQINTLCGTKTSVDTDPAKWIETKSYAEGASQYCNKCNRTCPLHIIATLNSFEEFKSLLEKTTNLTNV